LTEIADLGPRRGENGVATFWHFHKETRNLFKAPPSGHGCGSHNRHLVKFAPIMLEAASATFKPDP
ncbi:MAG: hypothetical protein ACRETL_01770, partial [Gammaproteobacteria bacterium]